MLIYRTVERTSERKALRHTAAVRWLRQGQRVEEVARMLGHTDAEMVRRHYAPWVRDLSGRGTRFARRFAMEVSES